MSGWNVCINAILLKKLTQNPNGRLSEQKDPNLRTRADPTQCTKQIYIKEFIGVLQVKTVTK